MSEEKKEESTAQGEQEGAGESGPSCDAGEYIIPGPVMPDGSVAALRHHADHSMSSGFIRRTPEGQPMTDDTLILRRREGTPYLDVVSSVGELRKGPSKVVTESYRKGWDEVFGKKQPVGQA